MRTKIIASAAVVGALGIGGVAGAVLGTPVLSGAATGTTGTTTQSAPASPASPGDRPDHPRPLDDALSGLVAKGTITQAQADAVKQAVKDEAAKYPREHRGFGHGRRGRLIGFDAAAMAIGIPDAQLRTELQGGKTLAQVAVAHGKTADDVINALVKEAHDHLAAEVTAGRITQAQADTREAAARTRITDLVNNGRGAKGDHGPDDDGPEAPDSSSGSGSTSTAPAA